MLLYFHTVLLTIYFKTLTASRGQEREMLVAAVNVFMYGSPLGARSTII
jgi:hypothetical protein